MWLAGADEFSVFNGRQCYTLFTIVVSMTYSFQGASTLHVFTFWVGRPKALRLVSRDPLSFTVNVDVYRIHASGRPSMAGVQVPCRRAGDHFQPVLGSKYEIR